MAVFFIRTDAAASGPFTGIELREAAMAGILRPDSVIAGGPEGPWILVSNAGLFSEKRVPLPHPPDVVVPQYQVRGMPGAFQGPFKLRELIGFAVRGMLPSDALLQSNAADPWVPVERIKILSACLRGELALIDQQGNVIRRAVHPTAQPLSTAAARAPVEISRSVDTRDTTAFASSLVEISAEPTRSRDAAPKPVIAESSILETHPGRLRDYLQHLRARVSTMSPSQNDLFGRRMILPVLGLSGMALIASVVLYWQQLPMRRTQLIGEWIGNASSRAGEPSTQFGIAFRPNGRCVVFNPIGESWTGDFRWEVRNDKAEGLRSIETFTVDVDTAEPQHFIDDVGPTDGYLRFFGPNEDAPTIDGHRLSEAFVRRESKTLLIGYLTTLTYGPEKKRMQAAWITTNSASDFDAGQRLGSEAPKLSALKATELLAAYGMPDEARPAYPFESSSLRPEASVMKAQVVRFANEKWLLKPDGNFEPTKSSD